MVSFANRTSLVAAIAEWDANAATAEATYGHISVWNVSRITDMSSLFSVRPTRPLKKPSDPFHRPAARACSPNIRSTRISTHGTCPG